MTHSAKKQIAMGVIDEICKKEEKNRNHVARVLDLQMEQKNSTVSKMQKN